MIRRKSRRDSAFFAEWVFGWRNQAFHVDWHDVTTGRLSQQRLVVFAPADHGKSSHFCKAIPLWLIGSKPNTRGAIFTHSQEKVQERITAIQAIIESDSPEAIRYRWVFPHVRRERRKGWPEKWTDRALLVERTEVVEQPTLAGYGPKGDVLGSRLDWIILDDLCDVDSALSPAGRRDLSRRFWSEIASRVVEGGSIWVIGTAWHPDDLMHECARHGYYSLTYRTPHLLSGDAGRDDVFSAYWPERWSEERLMAEKGPGKMPGHEFDRQCLCIPTSESMRVFGREYLEAAVARGNGLTLVESLDPAQRDGSVVLCGVDLSAGEKATSDRTAMFIGERDDHGRKIVRHIRAGRWGQTEILRNILDVQRRYRPDGICVESNATQRFIVHGLRDANIMRAIGGTAQDLAGMRIIPTVTGSKAKTDPILGIKGMALDFEGGKWIIPQAPETQEWLSEMERWTPDSHTGDMLSASYQWEMGLRKMGRG